MILAKELRIGSLINVNHQVRIDNTEELLLINPTFIIEKIDEDGDIIIYSEFENLHISCNLEDIEPIPITEDVLVKLEKIEKKADGLFILKLPFNYEIRIIEGKKGYTFWVQNTMISASIDHIHQLQNLYFTLTNEELKNKRK